MPLASRATQARAERAGAPPEAGTEVQPRKPAEEAPAPPEPAQTAPSEPAPAPKKRGRPPGSRNAPRAPRAATGAAGDVKELKARQKELEREFKSLAQEKAQDLRAHEQKYRERRVALETEHRLIAGQLSSKIFNG